jgi:hypothetical protein
MRKEHPEHSRSGEAYRPPPSKGGNCGVANGVECASSTFVDGLWLTDRSQVMLLFITECER